MKARLLMADGDNSWTERCQRYFSKQDFVVETVSGGLACLDRIESFNPDMLVLDLNLPWGGADGVLARLREEADCSSLAVVLTAWEAPRTLASALEGPPVVRCLYKPLHMHVLFACIRSCTKAQQNSNVRLNRAPISELRMS